MRILIEVKGGFVQNVWCSEPEGVDVVVRDMDMLGEGPGDDLWDKADPIEEDPTLRELCVPDLVVY